MPDWAVNDPLFTINEFNMFERRLKIFLGLILALAALMLARATQLQVVQRARWQAAAAASMKHWDYIPTPRGRILDYRGLVMAEDVACIDAAVDYRAIVLDKDWIKAQARARIKSQGDALPRGVAREKLLADEMATVAADIGAMWAMLAEVSGKSADEIEEVRQDIRRRVELLHRNAWYNRYAKIADSRESRGPSPWYQRWLVDVKQEAPDQERESQIDAALLRVGEEVQSHVILPDISNEVQMILRKGMPRCPGLELRESTHRQYSPTAAFAAAHILGRVSSVAKEDLERDPYVGTDDLRRYLPRDAIGRAGLEGLAEPILRGAKGQIVRIIGQESYEKFKSIPGQDATATIDLALQEEIIKAFQEVTVNTPDHTGTEVLHELHGAAVVIDVRTSEVRAMVSYPTYDLNRFDADYIKLSHNDLDRPLQNRATMAQHEPGSTVKTIIGSVAVTRGLVGVDEGIECTGFLSLPDRVTGAMRRYISTNRCWTASGFSNNPLYAHHNIPTQYPHLGDGKNPPGFLTVSDALMRSCNVYFQNVADRLRLVGVRDAMSLFGLGRRTGLGIPEVSGRIPEAGPILPAPRYESDTDRHKAWLAGIGQGEVAVTPIQLANVAATLARDGIWKRPRLLTGPLADSVLKPGPDDTRDLHLSPEALAAVKKGMIEVVNAKGGTGEEPRRADMLVPGKTGSAQTGKLRIPVRDEHGDIKREPPDEHGNKGRVVLQEIPIDPVNLPWYIGVGENNQHLAHAWFIGYAPADHPQIAFCVFVEFGGGGGRVAGGVAREVLEACVRHHYLSSSVQTHLTLLDDE